MKAETGAAIRAIIATDGTITADAAKAAFDALTGEPPVATSDVGDRVISRADVAVMMGKSVKAVDIYGRRGIIRRVYLTGGGSQRIQAQGYSRNSVLEAIRRGKPSRTTATH